MFSISVVLTVVAIIITAIFGLRLGVDFKGGSVLEIQFLENRPDQKEIKSVLDSFDFVSGASVQITGDNRAILKFGEVSEEQHQLIIQKFSEEFKTEEKRFASIGPVIGQELKRKSVSALLVVFALIIIYITFVFRKLSSVLSSWKMGGAALVALFHDVAIPIGVFSLLGYFYNVEISSVFVAAVLTILGYSVSDSVVVFDRIRENVLKFGRENFGSLVHKSIMQTLSRSINTSLTTILALGAIYFFGGESTKMFSLALIIGIGLGTYSSIFIASPLLVWGSKHKSKQR